MTETRIRRHGPDTDIVYFEGELDLETAGELRTLLVGHLNGDCRHLVLNMKGVTFLDSTGLGVITATMLKAQTVDVRFSIVEPNPRILDIFRIVGLRTDRLVWASEDEVLEPIPG